MSRYLEISLLGLGIFLLAAISASWIYQLGVEYDEAHFYPTAVKIAYGAEEHLPLPHGITVAHRPIPFMTMPYVGVLDALVYAVPYRLFGYSPLVPRWTNVALGALIFLLAWYLARAQGGPWAGLFALGLLLCDLELLLHIPTNYGPLLLQQLLTLTGLLALLAWWRSAHYRFFFLAVAAFALAFHEKLTYLWILSSLALAAALTYRKELLRVSRWWLYPAGLLLALCIVSPILYFAWQVPEVVLGFGKQSTGLRTPFLHVLRDRWDSLDLMLRGTWMMESTAGPVPETLRRGPALLLLFLASFCIPHRGAQLCSLTALGVWLWNLIFPDAGRMHHVLLLAPLWQCALAIGFGQAKRFWRIPLLALLLWSAYDVTRCLAWYSSRTLATGGVNHWADVTAQASDWLAENPTLTAVTTSWGVSRPVFALSGGRTDVEEHYFDTLGEFSPETKQLISQLLQKRRVVWLVSDVMPLYQEQWQRVTTLAKSLSLEARQVAHFPSRDDRFHLRAYRFDSPEAPLPLWRPLPAAPASVITLPPRLDFLRLTTAARAAGENQHITLEWLSATDQLLYSDTRPLYWLPLVRAPHTFDFAPDLWPASFTRRRFAEGRPAKLRLSYELGGAPVSLSAAILSSDEDQAYRSSPSPVLGEYGSAQATYYVTERQGKLVVLTPSGEILPAGEARLSPSVLTLRGQSFPRLPEPNRNFRIQLQKPLAELRAIADQATPPAQPSGLLPADLVDLRTLAPGIRLDIRYATANNFMGAPLYSQAAAYLQRPAAQALLRAHEALASQGFGLLIHDAYRPWRVTRMFWDATPEAQRNFVADPAKGSRHNRGCAVDLTLYDLSTGLPVEMPSGFDEFSPRAFPDYPGGTSRQRWLRGLLRRHMEAEGFTVNDDEWWHFDYRDWRRYPVLNLSFEQLAAR